MSERQEALRDLMSDISEEYWCAGWLTGLEYSLWGMVQGESRRFGMGEVSEEEVADLRRLSDEVGGWWVWSDEAREEVFVPMAEWLSRLAAVGAAQGGE